MLPNGSEPLVLADGTKIDPKNGSVVRNSVAMVEVPTHHEARDFMLERNRRLADLPAIPAQITTIGAVLCYVLLGVSDKDIAVALNIHVERIQQVCMSDMFGV